MNFNGHHSNSELYDYGPDPFIVNINRFAQMNPNFRTALWTGSNLQLVVMCLRPGECIGLEMHPHTDQFIRIESGCAIVKMGSTKERMTYSKTVDNNYAVVVPAGTWHNIINSGNRPLKIYTIYAPPQHPAGTMQQTKEIAQEKGH